MPDSAIPQHEFDQEMRVTRRLLERVPSEHGEWKPHEKSFSLGHLAQLVSWIPGWIAGTLRHDELDLAATGIRYSYEPTEVLLEGFDRALEDARAALDEATGDALQRSWSLKHGDHVLYSAARGDAARNHLSHLIHHRGQLTVYLRLLDVPLPSIYGPTADERW
jgi:uncharacterized damage-inducible protein DinB